jgi:CHAT domain-containing protein
MNRMQSTEKQKPHLLTVAQPSAYGQSHLPGTREELNQIRKHCQDFAIANSELVGDAATVDAVAKGMEECNWVHFACHGVQDISNPTESALLLAGTSHLTLSKIIQLSLPHADLAFLSACQTATGAEHLPEEAAHLAAGMLLAGYRGVIATMWKIMDDDAPQVADVVYGQLFKDGNPDATRAAHALHVAIKELRKDKSKSFMSWVPFIHIGV